MDRRSTSYVIKNEENPEQTIPNAGEDVGQ